MYHVICVINVVLFFSASTATSDAAYPKDSRTEAPQAPRLKTYFDASSKVIFASEMWQKGGRAASGGISNKCSALLGAFNNATTRFLSCIMSNARPLEYCENCVGEFASVINTYDTICDDDENGTTCQDELLRADNVQVVLLAYDFAQGVWDKSTCHNCYNSTRENDTTVYRPTEDTLNMLEKIQDTQDCFHDFADNTPDNETVCSICKDFYSCANSYYNKLDEEGKLCSDLKDSMNYTRRMWSKKFKCTVAVRNDLTIYAMAVMIGFLPPLLYIGAFVYGTRLKKRQSSSEGMSADGSLAGHSRNESSDEAETRQT